MLSSITSICRWAIGSICLLYMITCVSAADVLYCSEINTADTARNSSIYQSNGLCSIFCNQNYAFAVLQYDACWCSNYAPSTETDGCNRNCPGYPQEQCGGIGKYGYIELMKLPSGTRGASSASTTTRLAPTTVTQSPETVTATIVILPPIFTSKLEVSPILISSSTEAPQTTSSASRSSGTRLTTPSISLETVTGQVRTITLLPTLATGSDNATESPAKSSKGLGVGGAVGLTVGLIVLFALIGAIIYFCLKRRNKQKKEAADADTSKESVQEIGGRIPSRTMSENSRYVLGTDGRQVVEAWENDNRDGPGSRRSRLMPVDPRLDPFAPVYQRGENKSRESVNTIRDDHDYSRRVHQGGPILRATNPDE